MKLTIERMTLTFKSPVTIVGHLVHVREGFRLSLATSDGVGRGEVMPLLAFGTETVRDAQSVLEGFSIETLPSSLTEIRQATDSLWRTPAAKSGVEAVLLDLLAQRQGLSVAKLLNPQAKHEVHVNALIDGRDLSELAANAERAVAGGFRTVKVKVAARTLSTDAQRLLGVRRAVGNDVRIRVDANGGWSEAGARTALRGLQSLELELCEQPVHAGDVDGLRRLRRLVPCRLAADESVLIERRERLWEADPAPAADVLVLKPTALGGLLPALDLAEQAARHGMSSYVTTLMDGPLARAAATHLAAALPMNGYAHGLSTVELFHQVAPDACTPRRGSIQLPTSAGWGV